MRQLTIVKSTRPMGFEGRWCELADDPCIDQSKEFDGCGALCPKRTADRIFEKKMNGYIKEGR